MLIHRHAHVCSFTGIYVSAHAQAHVLIHRHAHVCSNKHMCSFTSVHICVHAQACVLIHKCAHVCSCIGMYAHSQACTYVLMHRHVYSFTSVHICTHAQACVRLHRHAHVCSCTGTPTSSPTQPWESLSSATLPVFLLRSQSPILAEALLLSSWFTSAKVSHAKAGLSSYCLFPSTVIWVERAMAKPVRNVSEAGSERQLGRLATGRRHGGSMRCCNM